MAVVVAQGHSVPVERQPAMAATIAVPLVDVPDNAELEMAGVGT
jgi:hypothetical protein